MRFRKIKVLLSFFLCILPFFSWGKNDNSDLSALSIDTNLQIYAHAVVRYDSTFVEVADLNRIKFKRKYAITILDENGKDYGNFLQSYNNQIEINHIRGALLNATGKLIRRLKEKDILDRSMFGLDYTFNSDSRFKAYSFVYPSYPYTVIYEFEKTIKSAFFLPGWSPQINSGCSVDQAFFSLSYPEPDNIRHQEHLMPASLQKSNHQENSIVTQTWLLTNLAAFELQPLSNPSNFNTPTLTLAATEFNLLGHNGKMNTWKNFGLFNYELNKERDELPESTRKLIRKLIENDTSSLQKIQTLYSYMQKNTRYVADEYGLSGWQTFDANEVCTKGYGDCKGLTNYLKALLKEAGITAYAALANAGEADYYKIDPNFPANTFNHVILCVPAKTDTTWVECTNQQLPAGYLGGFTQNRNVLLTTEKGGFLLKTPAYKKDKSFLIRNAKMVFNKASEEQTVLLHNEYSGLMQDDMMYMLKTFPEDKKQKWVNQKFSFPSYLVTNYDYTFTGTRKLPAIVEKAETKVMGLVHNTGKRTFINLDWMLNPMQEISQSGSRTKPIVLRKDFKIIDSVLLVLPEDAEIESMPSGGALQFPFASYVYSFQKRGNQILFVRQYQQNEGIYSKENFDDYQKMYHSINAGKENLNVVLIDKKS